MLGLGGALGQGERLVDGGGPGVLALNGLRLADHGGPFCDAIAGNSI